MSFILFGIISSNIRRYFEIAIFFFLSNSNIIYCKGWCYFISLSFLNYLFHDGLNIPYVYFIVLKYFFCGDAGHGLREWLVNTGRGGGQENLDL